VRRIHHAARRRDQFFNVPARKKFLRSEQTELAHIASLVTHYSLAHPDKAFELRNGANSLLDVTPVETLRERVYQVFGGKVLDDLIDLGAVERELDIMEGDEPASRVFLVRGFVSGPQVQKLNRNSIFLFVNGRLIRDKLLLHALSSAYHNLMPPACYPFALLFLDCDCEEVDVNVHPSKTEVRFRHGTFVHDFVRDSIRDRLVATRPAATLSPAWTAPQHGADLPFSDFTQRIENQQFEPVPDALAPMERVEDLPVFTLGQRFDFQDDAPSAHLPVPETHAGLPAGVEYTEVPQSLATLPELRPLGQIHDSFIVAAGRDGLWIIDQHVAHERILFEKVLREQAHGRVEKQQLLMPILIELTASQQIEYARIADELARTGFESEPFGTRTIAVKAAPADVGPGDVEKIIQEILEIAETELRKASVSDLRRGMAASIACRAAIKVNMRLDQTKMQWLLKALSETECPMSCPHGRPIALRYSTREILRSFHRI
jgi:DNA mismatch repair protein MutL